MEAFRETKERFRDKSRDNLCAILCEMGLDARSAERGAPQEAWQVDVGDVGASLGVIEIGTPGSPIRFINVTRDNRPQDALPGLLVSPPHQRVILDMDSSESSVHGEQEGAA